MPTVFIAARLATVPTTTVRRKAMQSLYLDSTRECQSWGLMTSDLLDLAMALANAVFSRLSLVPVCLYLVWYRNFNLITVL